MQYTTATKIFLKAGGTVYWKVCGGLFLFVGIPVNAFLIVYLWTTGWTVPPLTCIAILLAAAWSWIGPSLIWNYEVNILPTFWTQMLDDRILPSRDISEISSAFFRINYGSRKFVVYGWTLLLLLAFVGVSEFMKEIGMPRIPGVWFWLWLICLIPAGILTGEGFAGVIMMIQIIRSCIKRDIAMHPYHPDGLGGLSCFGRLAIGTTLLFSSGALFLPILLIGSESSFLTMTWMYVLVSLYSASIACAFLLPTVQVCIRAKAIRDRMISDLNMESLRMIPSEVSECVRLSRKREIYQDILKMGVYPFNPWILSKLIGSVITPLLLAYVTQRLRL